MIAAISLLLCASSTLAMTYTGGVISNNPLVPLPPTFRSGAVPQGRPVYTHTPQITEQRNTLKTTHSKFNVPVPVPNVRRKVVQDVHHSFVAKPYTVHVPVPVEHPVPVYQPYNVYQHEVEVQEPLQVFRHHQHTQRLHHYPLVKTADVVHHSVNAPIVQIAGK